ncbi:MAG: acyl-CoA dehydrogenase [Bacteroidetes bacterium]|jgi:alkylation response protein AidB-like acyl-CoA dehydrogenase|nr:acyl-CoA dehydrogenase [Bacteroidota bacterium]
MKTNFSEYTSLGESLTNNYRAQNLSGAAIKKHLLGSEHQLEFTDVTEFALKAAHFLHGLERAGLEPGIAFSLGAHYCAGYYPVTKYGSSFLKNLISEDSVLIAGAMTESQGGSDAFNMKTHAMQSGNSYIINGVKTYCTNACEARFIVVYAITDKDKGLFGGITAFLIDRIVHDVIITPISESAGLKHTGWGEVMLQDCEVDEKYIVGTVGAGGFIFMESMDVERAVLSYMHCGSMRYLLNTSINFCKSRTTGEGSISNFQAIQFRIADMALDIESSELIALKALHSLHHKPTKTPAAAQAKITCSEAYVRTAQHALLNLGGSGFSGYAGVQQHLAASLASCTYSGTNDIMRNIIAGNIV